MDNRQKVQLHQLMEKAKERVNSARETISELRVAAKAIGDDARYVVYDAEDASYALRRLHSDLCEGLANLENEENGNAK